MTKWSYWKGCLLPKSQAPSQGYSPISVQEAHWGTAVGSPLAGNEGKFKAGAQEESPTAARGPSRVFGEERPLGQGPVLQPMLGREASRPDEEASMERASLKLLHILHNQERRFLTLQKKSVCSAAVAIPQIARTMHWPSTLVFHTLRSYLFYAANLSIQILLFYMMGAEQEVMDKFSGEINLCDFGADTWGHGEGSVGPGGTKYTPSRIYSFDQWITRLFVRDSLSAIFPELFDEIHDAADPGEYGMENFYCRLVCHFLFMLMMTKELLTNTDLLRTICLTPRLGQAWVVTVRPGPQETVKLRVAGMPLGWKVWNALVIWVPKMLLWYAGARQGTVFLMETSGIKDVILNSCALTFILSIDAALFEVMPKSVQHMLDHLEDVAPEDLERHPLATESEVLVEEKRDMRRERDGRQFFLGCVRALIPMRMGAALLLTYLFNCMYYYGHCEVDQNGRWVSQPMHLPNHMNAGLLSTFFPSFFPVDHQKEPYWTMPTPKSGQ